MARPRPPMGSSPGGPNTVLRFMNRRINTYRGQMTNVYGSVSDVGGLYLTNVPAALAETSQQAFDPATQRLSIIRAIRCIAPGWADIETTDTVLDTFTGFYYMIENIEAEPGLGYYSPARQILTLRMRSGVTVAGEHA